ncbi:AMP-binding protein [Plantactinospora sp. KBS50]|uniref:AMP-binding protein n=1 Tax=Plantactinospora sp. KBS50 TaxID=2024580 RepID=UPI000BAAA766|nr:AMP-binding protein [Plantactinospora sp. KBS50]ASW54293.1 hypothetical protein CIK06_08955 [Plantactinospora sp. KBS50]
MTTQDTAGGVDIAARIEAIWADVVGLDGPVERDQGFLSSGGHSLAAARLIARIRADLAVDLPMSVILRDDPTLIELAQAVTDRLAARAESAAGVPAAGGLAADGSAAGAAPAGGSAAAGSPAAGSPAGDGAHAAPDAVPLAPTLRRIWTWHRLHPDSPAYNVVRVLRLAGRVQPAALRAALADLAARHEALRCAVVEPRPGQPEVVLGTGTPVPLSVEVVRGEDGAAVEEALRRVADRPFPMDTAPLWRVGAVYAPALDRTFLVLAMHHIISDLRTTDIVLAELARAYAARAGGAAPQFAEAAPSLLAHLAHETAVVGTPRWNDDLAWWSGALAGARSAVPLPLSAGERDEQVFAATTHSLDLPAAESDALDEALRSRRLTPALLFLTAASSVLAAWSGQDGAEVVGLPSVRISRPEDERLVGFLLDTLPLPVAPDRTRAFLHAYGQLRDAYAGAADHASPAFDDVIDRLRLPRSTRSPLIRLWFSDLTQAVTPAAFGDLAAEEHDLPPSWALFDLGLYLWRTATGYRLHLVSPRGLCAPADTAALLRQIIATASRAAADPARPLGELLAAPAAGDASAPASAGTGPAAGTASADAVEPAAGDEPAGAESVVEAVRRYAAQRPTAVALADRLGTLDYGTLDALVDTAAAALPAGVAVAVPARRDRDFVVRLLACWRAGATAVLIDAEWPQRRRRRAFEVGGVTLAYPWTGDGPAEPTGAAERPIEPAGPGRPARATEPAGRPAGGPAHVLFTSGTTGDPLAVRVATPVADGGLADLAALIGMRPTDRVSMLSGAAHDPVLRDIGLALRAGATVCLPPPETFATPVRLADWLERERVTVLSSTPALLALVFGAEARSLPALRAVVCGGSPLSATTAELIRGCAPDATVVNGYGCTETPQIVVAHRITPDQPVPPTAQVPIGAPLPGRRVELRTADGRRCDVGQLGELWIAEPHIAAGYLGDDSVPRSAAGRFGTDPSGLRWLRTGDLARLDAAGRLHLAGRTDRQVLLNGHRVMLEELEEVTRGCAGITDAVAQVVGDLGRQAVRIWAQRAPGTTVGEEAVRAHLVATLPAGVVPARVIVVDRLDMSTTLKPVAPEQEPAPAGPEPALDTRLRELAESVLGQVLDPATNFFDAGFTSVSLLQMSAELSDMLDRPVEALSLFHHPNLRALSAYLFGAPTGRPAAVIRRPPRTGRTGRSVRSVRSGWPG